MDKKIIMCGVGGQGTVLASKLIASAAMKKNIPVMSAETIGMAQKGGSVTTYIRMGEQVKTPMIRKGTADIIIGFEPAECVRMLPYLKAGGSVVVNENAIKPVTSMLSASEYQGAEMIDFLKTKVENLIVVNCDEACKELGSTRVTNMVLLGAALDTGELCLDCEDIQAAMRERMKEALWELNFKALAYTRKED